MISGGQQDVSAGRPLADNHGGDGGGRGGVATLRLQHDGGGCDAAGLQQRSHMLAMCSVGDDDRRQEVESGVAA